MDAKVAKIYYSPRGYWKGPVAIKKLAQAAKVSEDAAKKWLIKQALWQIYLPAPKHISCLKFDLSTLNALHQAGLLFFTTTTKSVVRVKIVDFASYFKGAEPLTLKDSALVTSTFQKKFTNEVLWNGHSCFRFTLVKNGKEMGKHNKHLTCTLRFTSTRKSLKDSTAPLLSCISPNSVCFGALSSFFVHLSFLKLHEITVIAQCDSKNVLKLQLEQPNHFFCVLNSSAMSGRTASSTESNDNLT